ncbi:hypothetical protein HK099_002772 [Clydaea vesicula]|uniref:Velvet domain-containing protein n=1 Tax=Clydaea vesicula TaxID=447962 RepID=A0AAD5U562_9FUNG|nr:hypothetical protein HK099_002772 [Clydaea vesicula]
MSASLYDERGIECLDYAQTHISKDFPNLLGQRIESPLTLRDDRGSWGTYFVFKDLSVRSPGNYTLKFRLYDLESKNFPNTLAVKTPIRIQLSTSVFSIFKPKDFTGMAVSTELTKTFRNQGVKLSIRNKALHQT